METVRAFCMFLLSLMSQDIAKSWVFDWFYLLWSHWKPVFQWDLQNMLFAVVKQRIFLFRKKKPRFRTQQLSKNVFFKHAPTFLQRMSWDLSHDGDKIAIETVWHRHSKLGFVVDTRGNILLSITDMFAKYPTPPHTPQTPWQERPQKHRQKKKHSAKLCSITDMFAKYPTPPTTPPKPRDKIDHRNTN